MSQLLWPKYWSFSFSIIPSKEHPGLITFRMDWLDLLAVQGTLKSLLQHHSSKASILRCSAFFTVQFLGQYFVYFGGFSHGSDGKKSAYNEGDPDSIPGLARFPGEGNGYLLQHSCLEKSKDKEAWWATVHGVSKSQTRLSN